ncbi:MAG: type II toxin-antitoxin system VapC family toxin [Verrucomicrobiota bacterium]
MILPDVNVLVHAHNSDSLVHQRARQWWEGCLSGPEGVALPWVTTLGFLRITTHRKIFANPLPVEDVLDRLDSWLALPHVQPVNPTGKHFHILRSSLARIGTAGNLTTDAHLAALAIERGFVLYSTDNDFARFENLRWVNPCA